MAKNARLSSKVSSLSKSKWLPNDIAAICHTPFQADYEYITRKSWRYNSDGSMEVYWRLGCISHMKKVNASQISRKIKKRDFNI